MLTSSKADNIHLRHLHLCPHRTDSYKLFLKFYFHSTVSFIKTGRFWKLYVLLRTGDQEEGMQFVPFFMFIAWNVLFINFTFGKGESQTANRFLSFDSLMSATLFYICPLFSFADKK